MSSRYPLLAVLATEVASGEQEVRLRIHARADQLQMLAVAGLVVAMIVGYQVAIRKQQIDAWRGRLTGRSRGRSAPGAPLAP